MKILDLTVHWFHFGSRRQRKVSSKLDRIGNAVLLDAAVKNPEVLAQVVNKYGEIKVPHDDKIAVEVENLKVKIHKEAVQTILTSRRQDLVSYVGELINMVMGLNSVSGRHQHKEKFFEGVTPGEQNGTSNMARRYHGRQSSLETSSNPSALARGLVMHTVLNEIINRQRRKQTRGNLGE